MALTVHAHVRVHCTLVDVFAKLEIVGGHESVEADASERSFNVLATSSVTTVLFFKTFITISASVAIKSKNVSFITTTFV